MSPAAHTEFFMRQQPRLRALGYRMLGSVSDAEDIVQEAYLRWAKVDAGTIEQPRAYLSRIVTRLCLDYLKSARVRRETYVGPWLPEPLLADAGWSSEPESGIAHDVGYAFMLLLDRLSPAERAAFVLHDVFGFSFDEIGATLGRSPESCRKLASRARARVKPPEPTPATSGDPEQHPATRTFLEAMQSGDINALRQVLTEDAVLISDGGSKTRAARRPILGRDRIARMFAQLSAKNYQPHVLTPTTINGLPGLIVQSTSGPVSTFAFELSGNLIHHLYVVRNPDKLRHV